MRALTLAVAAALLLAGSAAGKCEEIAGCLACGTTNRCDQCDAGLTPVANSTLCVASNACLAPGSRCVPDATGQDCDATDPRVCLACAGGATLSQGKCLPNCLDPRCDGDPSIGCPDSPENCQLCEAGYVSINGFCVQDGCIAPNCATCATAAATGDLMPEVCKECIWGREQTADGVCVDPPLVPCMDRHCSAAPGSCPDPDRCLLCMPGWTADSAGLCIQDGCRVANCQECVIDSATQTPADRCEECLPGYLATASGTCERLPPPPPPCTDTDPECERCDEHGGCAQCRKQDWIYDYHYGRCRPARVCSEIFTACLECGPHMQVCTRCERAYVWSWEEHDCVLREHRRHCRKGYRMVKGRCVRIGRRPPRKHCRKGWRMVKGRCVHIAHGKKH